MYRKYKRKREIIYALPNKKLGESMTHEAWVKNQFIPKMLKTNYRNVLIHFSLIEGFLRAEASKNTFDSANKELLYLNKITAAEFCLFEPIKKLRNELIHELFLEKLNEDEINKKVKILMEAIHKSYKDSKFLKEELFNKYQIIL